MGSSTNNLQSTVDSLSFTSSSFLSSFNFELLVSSASLGFAATFLLTTLYTLVKLSSSIPSSDDLDGQGGTVCPFDSLASLFNDPTSNDKNICIIPDRTNKSGCYVPEPGREMVVRRCFDINPASKNDPERDGARVHSEWKELKSKLSVYLADFLHSVNQDAENLTDEQCTFLERHGGVKDVYFYAFTIFTSNDFNYLGKALPKEAQLDTGALGEHETLEDRVAKELAKRKERAEARKRQRAA
jgi:hypothetical protein